MDDAVTRAWPLFGLSLEMGSLSLRVVRDEDAVGLARILEEGITSSDQPHFIPGLLESRASTPEERTQDVLRYHWGERSRLSAADWHLPFAVFFENRLVGTQSAAAKDFSVIRDVNTGSYLALSEQGRGIGTLMRAALVELSFVHLGAEHASSGYADDNASSRRVSEKLGYHSDGTYYQAVRGRKVRYQRVRLMKEDWPLHRPTILDSLQVHGLGPCRDLLGL